MRMYLLLPAVLLCAGLLLGNTQCQQNTVSDNNQTDGSPTFVTTMAVEDANGNPATEFPAGENIQFVLSVHNRSNAPQAITTQVCISPFEIAVVTAGTADVVFSGPNPGLQCMAVSLDGVPMAFAANETKTFTLTWNQMMPTGKLAAPGNYEVMGGVVCWNPPTSGSSAGYDTTDCMPPSTPTPEELTPTEYRANLVAFTIQ